MAVSDEFTTPVGRIVDGNPWDHLVEKDYHTKQPKLNDDGTPKMVLYFGLAIPKTDPRFNEIWTKIYQVGSQGYPGQQLPGLNDPRFSWKIDDGDDPKYAGKVGFAGCWILRLKTQFKDIKRVNAQGQDLMDKSQLKTGDYVDVYVRVNCNGQPTNPSVFLNPQIIRHNSYGEAIISGGPSVDDMAPAAAAVGSQTPIGGPPMAGAPTYVPPQQVSASTLTTPPAQQPGVPGAPIAGAPMGNPPVPAQTYGAPSSNVPGGVTQPVPQSGYATASPSNPPGVPGAPIAGAPMGNPPAPTYPGQPQ